MSDVCGECGLEFSNMIHIPDCSGHSQMAPPPVTLRDQFAMAALTGILSNPLERTTTQPIVRDAWMFADLMLEARKK